MMKIILPACVIPIESVITKIKGQKEYILRDRITVYVQDGEKMVINAEKGSRFLVSSTGDINAVNSDLELVWQVERQLLIQFLEGPQQ